MLIQQNIPLFKHTYFKLGGVADYFVEVKTKNELIEAVEYARTHDLPVVVLGGGSNVLISDQGVKGLVIKNRTSKVMLKGFAGQLSRQNQSSPHLLKLKDVIVQAESGVTANYLIRYTLDQGLAGLEDMLGLPGTVGGAIYNNSHHMDKLFGDTIIEVEALDIQSGKIKKYTQKDCQFAYDYSIFHKNKNIILTGSFLLQKADPLLLWEKANRAVKRRATTQPLGKPSSGCMFKNISLADKMRLGLPTASAGYLIDQAGLKGTSIGGATVSAVHANFIVNDGTATTADVLALVTLIKQTIKSKYGVDLVEEVIII